MEEADSLVILSVVWRLVLDASRGRIQVGEKLLSLVLARGMSVPGRRLVTVKGGRGGTAIADAHH